MTKQCIFCGERVNSREHVWPQWLVKIIKPLPGENKTLWTFRTDQHKETKQWNRSTPEVVIKNVCKHCNEGWMSELEQAAEPIFRPLITGKDQTLTGEQQRVIARWVIKVGMVLDSTSFPNTFYEEHERFHFRNTFHPPGGLALFLGRYSGRWNGFTNHRILHNGDSVPHRTSYVLTLAFGYLVLQLCNTKLAPPTPVGIVDLIEHRIRNGSWSTIEMVYPFRNSINWPPNGSSFNDSERNLQTFAARFGGT